MSLLGALSTQSCSVTPTATVAQAAPATSSCCPEIGQLANQQTGQLAYRAAEIPAVIVKADNKCAVVCKKAAISLDESDQEVNAGSQARLTGAIGQHALIK